MLIPETGFSFPSGHTTLSIAFFGVLIYLFKDEIKNKTLRYLFITISLLLPFLIAFSRLYLNVHWFTDVVAGLFIGTSCVIGSIYFSKK
jgi:undecaprenyl-diphosphatase